MAEHAGRAKSVMGGKSKSKKSGKKPHSIHVRRAKSGGFIAEHHHQPDETGASQPSEEHVLPDLAALQAHMGANMGDQPAAAPPSPDPSAAAAPPAGGPAPAPAAAPPGM